MTSIYMKPIGVIHTPFTEQAGTPIQSCRSTAVGEVEVFPEYLEGLEGVQEFSHLILLYVWHLASKEVDLKVTPFLDEHKYGVFATRYPCRPNSIGISVVKVLACEGGRIKIQGVDMLDQTPLLDIKPYIPEFDVHPAERIGWYSRRSQA